jgi:sugar lactone lactonase YvrE
MMKTSVLVGRGFALWCVALLIATAPAEELTSVPFDDEHWQLEQARIVEIDGRQALAGIAVAKGIDLADGVIEVDIKASSREARSYPGVMFHMASPADCERVYLRPHRAPLYDDAVQYAAVFNGIAAWQLDSGPGRTAAAEIPVNTWFTLRLELLGSRARVLIDGTPVLDVHRLRHGARSGGVGVNDTPNGIAYFANFRWTKVSSGLDLGPEVPEDPPPGLLRSWQLSSPLSFDSMSPNRFPDPGTLEWQDVVADPSGLVDIARFVAPTTVGPPTVIARTTIHADTPRVMPLRFGYSDRVTVFLNGRLVLQSVSDYRSRDSGFLGVVGLYDTAYLPLVVGDNTLALQLTETFGGWGFICQDRSVIFRAPDVAELWQASAGLRVPESALWDPDREVAYVSSFDAFAFGRGEGGQHLTRIAADGAVLDEVWIDGLTHPSGLAWRGNRVLAVERRGVAEVDPSTPEVVSRTAIPGGQLLNDIAVSEDGTVFVSDSRAGVVFRIASDSTVERWLELGSEKPNGLLFEKGRLLVALNPTHRIVSVDPNTRATQHLAMLPPGILDGLEPLGNGGLLVSLNEGKLFQVDPNGAVVKLYDSSNIDRLCADIEVVPERSLVLVPTYLDGKVMALRIPTCG